MKNRSAHIFSLFLISVLMFAQVGVNFFHRNHDVHDNKSITAPLKGDKAAIQKHDEHCKVCSIDCFNHAFVHEELAVNTQALFADYSRALVVIFVFNLPSFIQGRAPPTPL
ncbi:MAG: hypothetical protein QM734_10730 [Cyclobacteriaceae bacterium]